MAANKRIFVLAIFAFGQSVVMAARSKSANIRFDRRQEVMSTVGRFNNNKNNCPTDHGERRSEGIFRVPA